MKMKIKITRSSTPQNTGFRKQHLSLFLHVCMVSVSPVFCLMVYGEYFNLSPASVCNSFLMPKELRFVCVVSLSFKKRHLFLYDRQNYKGKKKGREERERDLPFAGLFPK